MLFPEYTCVHPLGMPPTVDVSKVSVKRTADVDAVTVKVAVPDMLPDIALIVVVPAATAVAIPAFDILALLVSEEVQVTEAVIFCVELSEYVPVAVNC
jgi:hypothetical protein